jgi:cation diffusion facilitator CzcD-associated flavoprotein CzcO
MEAYLVSRGLQPKDVEPLSRSLYLDYAQWFQQQRRIEVLPWWVERLDYHESGDQRYIATTSEGETIHADQVVLAVGFQYFKHIPSEFAGIVATGRAAHTCDLVNFTPLSGKHCAIIGGRQSAFEWAALLHEQGAATVHILHRHASPSFAVSDWLWVPPLVETLVSDPGWFRHLSPEERDAVSHHMWAEGRLKVEPWLEARLQDNTIQIRPNTSITAWEELPTQQFVLRLNTGDTLTVDQVILASGYKVNIASVPFLAEGNILSRLATKNGYPVLDEHFQTNVPGLYITSMAAGQDFGPFFGFTVSVRTSAKLIGAALAQPLGTKG